MPFSAELLGFDDYIPPYATARGEQILRGVNYASAAAGIRSETGQQLVGRIWFKHLHLHVVLILVFMLVIRVVELILRGK